MSDIGGVATYGSGQADHVSGRVDISDQAVTTTVHDAVMSCYGIVGFAPKGIGAAIARRFRRESDATGISILQTGDRVTIELFVVMEFGTPIFAVAKNVMRAVKFRVERSLGLPVERVDVNVQGLRVAPGAMLSHGERGL